MTPCRICCSPIEPFMTFGKMPTANGFLRPEDFATEYFQELQVGILSAWTGSRLLFLSTT